ncbi:MAG: VOC family protein [Chitinophagaceae bacterium]|nr:VOC family protein [Chitinophagaceae bacterium]
MKDEVIDLNIRALQHVGIPVTDIKRSEAFYKRLGFKNVMQSPFGNKGEEGICIMMKKESVIIELYQLPEKDLAEIANRKNGHIDHIAFDVPDIAQAFTTIKNAGFDILEDSPVFLRFWEKGCKYFYILGPDGERLEFNQLL